MAHDRFRVRPCNTNATLRARHRPSRDTFPVEYINGAGNSLAVVPIHGNSMIFANVMSGSGARYAAWQYIWWDAGGSVTLYSDSMAGKMQSACHPAE